MIKNISGNPKVLTVHGDDKSCTKLAEEIHEKFGLDENFIQKQESIRKSY